MIASILPITEQAYRSDPCEKPSLSKSAAHTIVTRSPLHARLEHPRLGGHPRPPTDATDNGQFFHRVLLGKGPDIVVIDADSYRTNAAKEARDNALAAGKMPIKRADYDEAMTAVKQIRTNIALDAGIVLEGGRAEVPIKWYETGAEGLIVCRSMPDWLPGEEFSGVVVELKTIRSAHPKAVARAMIEYGYDIQAAAYPRALGQLYPDYEGRIDFQFVFFETEPPYAVLPVRCSGAMREYGLRRWMRAVSIWERCLATNEWPGYARAGEFITVEPPAWALSEELMHE